MKCAWSCGAEIAHPANLKRHEEAHSRRVKAVFDAITVTAEEAVRNLRMNLGTLRWTIE